MINIVGVTLLNCILIIFTVLVQKLIYRTLLLNYNSLIVYWGIFVCVFFFLNLITNIIILKKSNR
ncbi:bacteriocin-like WGxF protein [Bacillus xiapuensis]|uniref:bacteriocin-like WGxF protein n=1 Tax=Bacillus xiapuensis TaxID=2014075 RepID=UPI0022B8080C|nr:bacteriocin-like WGxF protein [Bacillus xiapuensis]